MSNVILYSVREDRVNIGSLLVASDCAESGAITKFGSDCALPDQPRGCNCPAHLESLAKGGKASGVVPMVSRVDHVAHVSHATSTTPRLPENPVKKIPETQFIA